MPDESQVTSPCKGGTGHPYACTLGADDVCQGCGRTREEIVAWRSLPDDERRRVKQRAAARVGDESA